MDLTDDPLAGVDASELEADIDKAIDELFVKKTEGQEPLLAEDPPPKSPPKNRQRNQWKNLFLLRRLKPQMIL